MYQVGDYVVKPVDGVCRVNGILTPEFVRDRGKLYYQLVPVSDENARLYVAVDKTGAAIREIMTEEQAQALIHRIPMIQETWITNERERERCYKAAIQSNDPERLVGMIKLIYHRKQDRQEQGRKTTAVDGRYFDTAEKLLYAELEVVLQKERKQVYELIRECCEKSA